MAKPHILIVCYPAHGHINPSLQFAKRLLKIGIEVTFATSKFAHPPVSKVLDTLDSFNFAAISEGYGEGFKPQGFDVNHLNALKTHGPGTLRNVIETSAEKGHPVTCIIYTLLLTWALEVAREYKVPSALLWIQPATVFGIYYNYFNGYEDEIKNCSNDPSWSIKMPGLPLLKRVDLPSFILPSSSNTNNVALQMFKVQMEMLDEEKRPNVLVNTFDSLEPQALKAIEKYNMITIGPLISFPYSIGNDVIQKGKDYMEWLKSKPACSVVYVAFGSLMTPSKNQMEEIARGLLESNRPFLWVIREQENGEVFYKLSCIEDLQKKGMIIPWCSQIDVLKHPSLGCFVTHCGWNSTLESIIFGVPVIAFPQWTDQGTNAKLLQDVWRTGVRVVPNGDGLVGSNEIKRCVALVMDGGENGLEFRGNAEKWKDLALGSMMEGGSLDKNLEAFVLGEI
ncbi:hypothetical protein ACH5RR_031889 [Cinchona calisaya]|uniref:Glycosyltransferase n=1 Tax=Cinchona calisaya TaxID=153742 RepID=A0ABD2YKY3_9GENT